MLVVSRKVNEVITIGDDIEVTILGVHRKRVVIGIMAPKDKLVLRKELQRHDKS